MKKFFAFFAALLFAGSMMADSYTITFKSTEGGDGSSSLTSTDVADYIVSGAEYVSAISASGKVYNGQAGYGLKFGNSSNPGAVTLTLATAITPTSIVMNASPWGATEGSGLLQDSVYDLTVTGAKGTFDDFAYEYDGETEVSTIIVGTSVKRGYVKSITINFGGDTPIEPETIPTVAPAVPTLAEADVMGIYCSHYTVNNAHFGISGWAGAYQTLDLSGTAVGYWTDMTWECIIDPANTDAAHDFSAYENIHIDMWAPQAAKIKFTAEAFPGGGYKDGIVVNLAQGWNSLDFALSEFPGNYDFSTLKCFVFEQYQTPAGESFEHNPFAFANLYFWKTPALADPTNCAEAREAALSVSGNNVYYKDSTVYTIEGYVTAIQTAYSDTYHNISFWMADAADGGNVIEAYRAACASAEAAPVVGDKVAVTGALTKYGTTPEFGAGCTFVITEHAAPGEDPVNLGPKTIAEFLELANMKDTCILTGIIDSVVNTQYGNFNLVDATGKVYVYGLLTAAGESKKCYEEENLAAGDTLTIKAIYNLYNNKPQVKNAIFVEVKHVPVIPVEGDTIDVTVNSNTTPGALVWTDAVASAGWWQIMGATENYEFSLSNISTTETAGVYTIDDLDPDYSYITVMTATDTTDVTFVDGSVTVAVANDGTVTIVGALVGNDGNVYNFNLTYVDPKAERVANVIISNGTLYDGYASAGLYAVYGTADDNTAYVQLAIWAEAGFEGDFTEEDLDFQYVGSGVQDADGSHSIFSAVINVLPGDGEGVYSITADLLCYNNTLYKVSMSIGKTEGYENVDAAVKAIKRLVNGNVVIEKAGKKYNVNGANL